VLAWDLAMAMVLVLEMVSGMVSALVPHKQPKQAKLPAPK